MPVKAGHQGRIDGRAIAREELVPAQASKGKGLRGWLHNLNLFLAGMYTGISCAGRPHDTPKTAEDSDPYKRML